MSSNRSFFAPQPTDAAAAAAGLKSHQSHSSQDETRVNLGTPGRGGTPLYPRSTPDPPDGDDVKASLLSNGDYGNSSDNSRPVSMKRGDSYATRRVSSASQPSSSSSAAANRSGALPSAAAESSTAGVKALAPILSYCTASITMTVINKFVLSGSKFSMNLIVLLIQSLVGVVCVVAANRLGMIQLRELNIRDAITWAPISTLLVLTIWTGSKALQYLNIPVYTIFKNLTIILIAYGEVIWFGGRVTILAFFSFALMVLSSIIAAWSDISNAIARAQLSMPHTPDSVLGGSTVDPNTGMPVAVVDALAAEKARINDIVASASGASQDEVFDGMSGWGVLNSGYMWMALNCVVSAVYLLVMRKRIKLTGFKDWDTMYYNNLLSVPVLLLMSLMVEDWSAESWEKNFPAETRTGLLSAIVFSGACAIFIGYTTAWCVRTVGATTYSMVGALNKLPLAISGMVFFHDPPVTLGSVSAIGVGFLAGLVYTVAKNLQAAASKKLAAVTAATNGLANGSGGLEPGKEGIPMNRLDERERDRRRD